ncbi:hypothetical protein B5P46_01935 [Rhizobium leguminosarum]|uniref:RelA/SpoT domain-containing protein n=1 Tax=Rhizobium leguminosarum TaxID=384 RepID=A0A4Q1UG38_RHILE|nr:hypothetical protein [Rhizobium leguminosarum]RXT29848.1 hypothetical protein B5P46_01935 [Rhizobium leguminosarum]
MAWNSFSDKRLNEIYRANRRGMGETARRLQSLVKRSIASIEDRALVRVELRAVRIKTLPSIRKKAEKHGWGPEHALWFCSDLIGCRVVCNNVEDAYRFVELLKEALPIFPQKPEVQDQIAVPNGAGYRALHLNFGLDVGKHPLSPMRYPCEVQVRTRLQDAWAELSHDDIYKAEGLPDDLRDRFRDLAITLMAADTIASGIRRKVTADVTPSANRPNLSVVSADGRAHIFSNVFGRSPPGYLIQQAQERAQELNLTSLAVAASKLEDLCFRHRASEAYEKIMPVPVPVEGLFLAAIDAGANGEDWAIAELSRLAAEEWNEIDRTARHEALSALPATIEDFCEAIEEHEGDEDILAWSAALDTTSGCLVCGASVVDVYSFAEAAVAHYQADEVYHERIESAVMSSSVETGGVGDGSLCSYHDDQMRNDD